MNNEELSYIFNWLNPLISTGDVEYLSRCDYVFDIDLSNDIKVLDE